MNEPLTGQWRLHPFALDVMQPALDGGYTHAKADRQLFDGLLLLLIGFPKSILAHIHSGTELIAAILTFIQLYAFAQSILFCMRTTTHKTPLFEHTNLALMIT
ncbi:MAG: hypothetical protein IJ892_11560 [Prevotella sp.]|nr:hypothetical protein [Prevotella sp.]